MKFELSTAELYIPDGMAEADALARTTHLAIGSHQDDMEFMAVTPILECFQQADKWVTGVAVAGGSGSAPAAGYAHHNDEKIRPVRFKEQRKVGLGRDYGGQ